MSYMRWGDRDWFYIWGDTSGRLAVWVKNAPKPLYLDRDQVVELGDALREYLEDLDREVEMPARWGMD